MTTGEPAGSPSTYWAEPGQAVPQKRLRLRRVLLALYVTGLLALTLLPVPEPAYRLASVQGLDKVAHVLLFAGFATVWYWNLLATAVPGVWRVVGPSAALAALVELLQAPLPYRTADIWDFFWGVVGALAAYLVVHRVLRPARDLARR